MTEENLRKAVIALGKKCAVNITGFPEDADEVTSEEIALKAIKAALAYGVKANDELNRLLMGNHPNALKESVKTFKHLHSKWPTPPRRHLL